MAKRSIRVGTAIAGVIMVGGAVAACGGSDGSGGSYCKDLKAASSSFSALGTGDYAKLDDALDSYHALAKEAPSKIKADWKILDGTISTMQSALKSVGLTFSDLGGLQSGTLPPGIDAAKISKLTAAMGDVDPAKITEASKNIADHAKSECKVTLGS